MSHCWPTRLLCWESESLVEICSDTMDALRGWTDRGKHIIEPILNSPITCSLSFVLSSASATSYKISQDKLVRETGLFEK